MSSDRGVGAGSSWLGGRGGGVDSTKRLTPFGDCGGTPATPQTTNPAQSGRVTTRSRCGLGDAWVTFRQGWMAAGDAHALPVVRHFHRDDVLPRPAAAQAKPPSARPAQHERLRLRGVRTFGIPMHRRMSVAGWGRAGGCALGRAAPTAPSPSAPPDHHTITHSPTVSATRTPEARDRLQQASKPVTVRGTGETGPVGSRLRP